MRNEHAHLEAGPTGTAMNVLLLGRTNIAVADVQQQLQMPGVQLFSANELDGVIEVFRQADIDHVCMGAGLDLEERLNIVRHVFRNSEKTTVHMKDTASGPGGFLPFVQSVLNGLTSHHL